MIRMRPSDRPAPTCYSRTRFVRRSARSTRACRTRSAGQGVRGVEGAYRRAATRVPGQDDREHGDMEPAEEGPRGYHGAECPARAVRPASVYLPDQSSLVTLIPWFFSSSTLSSAWFAASQALYSSGPLKLPISKRTWGRFRPPPALRFALLRLSTTAACNPCTLSTKL